LASLNVAKVAKVLEIVAISCGFRRL